MNARAVEVSVIVPFGDDEETVGQACRHLARQLGELGLDFEILAVDEDSGDNSHAVLRLLRRAVPQLRIVPGEGAGRGFRVGAACARGRVLWLIEPASGARALSTFAGLYERVAAGTLDLALVSGRFVVARRARVIGSVDSLIGRGAALHARIERRARRRGLRVEVGAHHAPTPNATAVTPPFLRRRSRLVLALGAAMARL